MNTSLQHTLWVTLFACAAVTTPGYAQTNPSDTCNGCVRPLREMTDIKSWEDLRRFGLVGPDERDHAAGSNLILLAFRATGFGKGDWVEALGLLGTNLIDTDLTTRIAYGLVFRAFDGCTIRELSRSNSDGNPTLLVNVAWLAARGNPPPLDARKSIIDRRQTALVAIGESILGRFRFNEQGNYGRLLGPIPRHWDGARLRVAFSYALNVLGELEQANFYDATIASAIGAAAAVLLHDQHDIPIADRIKVRRLRSYQDALAATLERVSTLANTPDLLFMDEYCGQLQERELVPANDVLLFPQLADDPVRRHEALLKIVEADLKAVKQ